LISGILGIEYNYIARRETEAEDFLVIAGAGWKEGTIGQTRLAGSDYSEAAYALETRKPVISTNLAADKRFTPSPLLLEHCVMTAIVVPVLESDRPLGVVGAFSTHRRTVTQDDVRFLESLANTLASALQRERAYEALRVLNAELEQRVSERTAELQAAKVELEKRAAELESANVNLESFSYSVSHDLRTPLGTIHSLARSLLEGDTAGMPPLAHQSLTVITESAASMDRLIQSLLSLSRTTRQPLKKQEVRPDEMAREVVEELKPQVAGRHVEVAIDNMPACNADPILLKQVWSNLLSNAIKFTRSRETAHIEIGCAPCDGQERVYYVRDNGVGFDMAQADRLFGVFQRLHSEDEYEGTGIGLTIVERIVKRHGGRIWAESEEDKGATFHFTLGT
jgi:signal transduction histidine kinase